MRHQVLNPDAQARLGLMIITALLGFDKLVMVTTPERVEQKLEEFKNLGPKFEVVGL